MLDNEAMWKLVRDDLCANVRPWKIATMKKCDYCGRANEDVVTTCYECGSSAFASPRAASVSVPAPKLDSDEILLPPIAQSKGSVMTFRCRTPGEAYLVCDELEKADILVILPAEEELMSQFKRNGCVEVRASARAYESLAELRSVVEFQYKQVRTRQTLSHFGKIAGMGCGVMLVPGALVLAWLLTSYRKHGYERKARQLKLWFFLGVAAWVVVFCFFLFASK
jgi:hypothetical protein